MSFQVEIEVSDSDTLKQLDVLGGITANPTGVGMIAARSTREFIRSHQAGLDWKGSHYMQGDLSGAWLQQVLFDWSLPMVFGEDTILIQNTNPTLSHKITGGTISAQTVQNLTIPLVPEAKGYTAAEYEGKTGNKLFRAGGSLAIKGEGKGEVIPIYALKPSVYQEPWPDALPPQADIEGSFVSALQVALGETIQSGVLSEA
jgi:hypothetical protein